MPLALSNRSTAPAASTPPPPPPFSWMEKRDGNLYIYELESARWIWVMHARGGRVRLGILKIDRSGWIQKPWDVDSVPAGKRYAREIETLRASLPSVKGVARGRR